MRTPRLLPGIEKALHDRDAGDPHQLTGFTFMGAFLQAGLRPASVPDDSWRRGQRDGATAAMIKCPCGQRPTVFVGVYPEPCPCGRWFFFDGTSVLSLVPPPRRSTA
jgi:hypothetical protein